MDYKQFDQSREKGLWIGHAVVQAPALIIRYAGSPTAHLALLLFSQGSGVSYRAPICTDEPVDVHFKTKRDSKAQKAGLSVSSIKRAYKTLEQDGLILRDQQKTKRGRFGANRIFLLDPQTHTPLHCSPMEYGLLSANGDRNFLTIPRTALEEINTMKHAAEKAVYISALLLASRQKSETVPTDKESWRKLSGLGRNAFNRGMAYCLRRKLFTFSGGLLQLNDPQTGQPSEKWKAERQRIWHENAEWGFDLNSVKPEHWRAIIHRLLDGEFFPNHEGWSQVTKDIRCPFCGDHGSFTVNFQRSRYRCHSKKCGDYRKGRLGQLVCRILKVEMNEAKKFIQACTKESEKVDV